MAILRARKVKSVYRGAEAIAMGSTIIREDRKRSLPDTSLLAACEHVDAFSAAARAIVGRAQEEARELGRDYVGTEHIVLAAFTAGGAEGGALHALHVRRPDVLATVIRLTGPSGRPSQGLPPTTPVLRRVLDAAANEARRAGESCVGPEHLLTAVAGERTCVGARVLADVGVDAAQLRQLGLGT